MSARPSSTRAASSRSSRPTRSAPTPRRRQSARNWSVSGEVVRLLIGLGMLLLGVTLLIGLLIPDGQLTDWERNAIAPWFGSVRWILAFGLVLLGYYLERARGEKWDWELAVLGSSLSILSLCGLLGVLFAPGTRPSGGTIGHTIADVLSPLITAPGTGILLSVVMVAGLLLALDMSLPAVMAPIGRLMWRAIDHLFRPAPEVEPGVAAALPSAATVTARAERAAARLDKVEPDAAPAAPARGRFGDERAPAIPVAIPSPGVISSTFAPAATPGSTRDAAAARGDSRVAGDGPGKDSHSIRDGAPVRGIRPPVEAPAQSKLGTVELGAAAVATALKTMPEYRLPPLALLDDTVPPKIGDNPMDHERNAAIMEAKLASFNIPARVVTWNAGPVVTQYEVEPAPEIKVSRIEGLADDLAMALAARTIRIEAPIPGKSVVGIEIPN